MYEIVLHKSSFVGIFRKKKASQKLINHFTEVKIFCLWCTFGSCFARVFEGGSSKFEARDSMSSGEIRCSLAPKQMPAIVFRARWYDKLIEIESKLRR